MHDLNSQILKRRQNYTQACSLTRTAYIVLESRFKLFAFYLSPPSGHLCIYLKPHKIYHKINSFTSVIIWTTQIKLLVSILNLEDSREFTTTKSFTPSSRGDKLSRNGRGGCDVDKGAWPSSMLVAEQLLTRRKRCTFIQQYTYLG